MTSEVLDKFSELITTALGLVAALAWNTAIQNLFDTVFGGSGSKLTGQFVYATLTTIVVNLRSHCRKPCRTKSEKGRGAPHRPLWPLHLWPLQRLQPFSKRGTILFENCSRSLGGHL